MPENFPGAHQRSSGGLARVGLHSDGQKLRRAPMPFPRGHHRERWGVIVTDVFVRGAPGKSRILELNTAACCCHKMNATRAACGHKGTAGGMDCALHTVHLPGRGTVRRSALPSPCLVARLGRILPTTAGVVAHSSGTLTGWPYSLMYAANLLRTSQGIGGDQFLSVASKPGWPLPGRAT